MPRRLLLVGAVAVCSGWLAPTPLLARPFCGGPALVTQAVDALFRDLAEPDVNADAALSAADVAAASRLPVALPCPPGSAALRLEVVNRTGRPAALVRLRGERLACACDPGDDLVETFSLEAECLERATGACAEQGGLAPGPWNLAFEVVEPATGQLQYRRAHLVSGVGSASRWTAFASVLVVDNPANTGNGSLRSRLQQAAGEPKPLLIRFDDEVFPAGAETVIPLTFQLTTLDTDDVTVDAIDALGLAGNRVIDAQSGPIGTFSIGGARNHLLGLRLRGAGQNNRDGLRIAGATADGNVIEEVIIENVASGDGISVDRNAGKGFDETVNVIRGCEISEVGDKGIKVTTGGFARVENSHVHDNLNGGIQATLGGHLAAIDNLVERNGGGAAGNGFAVQGLDDDLGFSSLTLEGNLARDNLGNGLSARSFASAVVRDSVFVGNATAGGRFFDEEGHGPLADVEGAAFLCNGDDGVIVVGSSRVDLGGGPFFSVGANAFARNASSNLRNATGQVLSAVQSQWEQCGSGDICDAADIRIGDLADFGENTRIEPASAQRGEGPPIVDEVRLHGRAAGARIRIVGAGFNVIDAVDPNDCGVAPSCEPLRGTCVEVDGTALEIEALTPTSIFARLVGDCLEPVDLVVRTQGLVGEQFSIPVTICEK